MSEFMFQKLEVYQRSLQFIVELDKAIGKEKGKIPYARLDQLSRASLSIPLNIAEGNGRWHPKDRKHFFAIARGSAFECVPILEILKSATLLEESKYVLLFGALETISKMLTGLIKREDGRIAV